MPGAPSREKCLTTREKAPRSKVREAQSHAGSTRDRGRRHPNGDLIVLPDDDLLWCDDPGEDEPRAQRLDAAVEHRQGCAPGGRRVSRRDEGAEDRKVEPRATAAALHLSAAR